MTDKVDDMKIARVTLKEFLEVVRLTKHDDLPPFGHGQPGIGKTMGIYGLGKEMKWKVIKLDAHLKDPTDIKGILFIVDGKARYILPEELPTVIKDGEKGIVFIDEILFATPTMLNALHSFIQEKKIGDYVLPEGWIIVCASNREIDGAMITELSGPTRNRFRHYQIVPDLYVWMEWAVQNGINPMVTSFLGVHSHYFAQMPDGELTYASPRIWEQVSKELDKKYQVMRRPKFDSVSKQVSYEDVDLEREAIKSCVGLGIASEFFAHQIVGEKALKLCEQILAGTMPKVSYEPALLWTVNMFLINRFRNDPTKYADPIGEYSLRFDDSHPEFALLLLQSAKHENFEALKKSKAWKKLIDKYIGIFHNVAERKNV